MSLYGIFSSPWQRKKFFLSSVSVVLVTALIVLIISLCSPETRGWNLVLDVFVGLLVSAIFVIIASVYVKFFFADPYEISLATKLLPQDIDQALTKMAEDALEYNLFVRTGRHFRAKVLTTIVSSATARRQPVKIEAILLDFRNEKVCERYASYRKSSSFDHYQWSAKYVQTEILATILKLIEVANEHRSLVTVNLYLSSRLSTFRYDGSHDQIIVTREDPKDIASRYRNSNSEFSAYWNELSWARQEAAKVEIVLENEAATVLLRRMFDNSAVVAELENEVTAATNKPSPYVR